MYQALYRKYRPVDFDSVVGQKAIIKTLKNSIINNNFSHAYMFFGPRGTGKTTVSKIFARNVNCLDPKDGSACGKCNACKVSFAKECIDIIEIDAASNNGVDEIRELKNKITLVPSDLKYKVYIIDEVHMLSIGAFNALLKTLEEPPEHAIFILATTDPQKVPETIISRCQTFSFKRISTSVIADKLKEICKKEKIKIADEVIENIAVFSNGGLRDALVLLDKLVSYSDNKTINMEDFIEVNSIVSISSIETLIDNIMTGNVSEVIKNINEFDSDGKNFSQISIQLLNYLRNTIVSYYVDNKQNPYSIDLLQELANVINENMFDIKKTDNIKIFMEMLLLKFMNTNITTKKIEKEISTEIVEKDSQEEIKSTKIVEKKVEKEVKSPKMVEKEIEEPQKEEKKGKKTSKKVNIGDRKVLNLKEIIEARINNTFALADKNELKQEKEKFEKLKEYSFDQECGHLVCDLLDSNLRVASKDNLIISYEYQSNLDKVALELDKIIDTYNKLTNSDKKIAVITDEEWEKLKQEYINKKNNKETYEVIPEPAIVLEELDNNDIISSSAMELFGEVVEID